MNESSPPRWCSRCDLPGVATEASLTVSSGKDEACRRRLRAYFPPGGWAGPWEYGLPGEPEIDVHGEARGFGGQRAPPLTVELTQGRFGSAATLLPRPRYPGLRIEGRYSILARARRRNLALVATTTLFPMEGGSTTVASHFRPARLPR